MTRIGEASSAEDILKVWKYHFSASESCESVKDDGMVFEEMLDNVMGGLIANTLVVGGHSSH